MPVSYIFNKLIKDGMKKFTKSIELKIFTDERNSDIFNELINVLRIYQESSNGKFKIEVISDQNLVREYQISHFPAISFINDDGIEIIRYLAIPSGPEIEPFIQALFSFSGTDNYYEASIKDILKEIESTTIKVLITSSCAFCPQQVNIVNQFALASGGKIKTIIIDANLHPEIAENYGISNFPFTIINENQKIVGLSSPRELLDGIIGGKSNV